MFLTCENFVLKCFVEEKQEVGVFSVGLGLGLGFNGKEGGSIFEKAKNFQMIPF